MQIIIGILVVIVGFYMAYRPRFFVEFLGHQSWAEKIFQVYDDELAYKLIGVIVIFLGALIMTGLVWNLLGWVLSPIIRNG